MSDIPLDPLRQAGAVSKTGAVRPQGIGPQEAGSTSPAFRALLEQLEARTRELEESSRTLDSPETLAGAVDTARASLQDAVSLSDRLLEAYRESQHQKGTAADTGLPEERDSA